MRPEERDAAHVWDMLDAAKSVAGFVSGRSADDYEADRMLQSAVERQIEIIGEAASKVSKDFQDAQPEIPWRRIIAQRHVLAHEYGDVDNRMIWNVATVRIPELMEQLRKVLPTE